MRKEDFFHVVIFSKTAPQLHLGRATNRSRRNWQSGTTREGRKKTSLIKQPTPFWMVYRKIDWGLSTRSNHTSGRRTTTKRNRPTTRMIIRRLHHRLGNHRWRRRRTTCIWKKWQRGRHHKLLRRNIQPNVRHHRQPQRVKIQQHIYRQFRDRSKRNKRYIYGRGYIAIWGYTVTTKKDLKERIMGKELLV